MPQPRAASKSEYTFSGDVSLELLNTGSLQRIADAVEKMAANWIALTGERDRYKRYYEEEKLTRHRECKRLDAQIRGLKGQITKMRKQETAHA